MSEVEDEAKSRTCGPAVTDAPFAGLHVAMVVAHPDDEVLGAGGQFAGMRRLSLIHLTDGAPSDRAARSHSCVDRRSYGALRAQELAEVLLLCPVPVDHIGLGLLDQHATFHLAPAAAKLTETLAHLGPDIVLTHPYEGGHPDHDAAAFITAAALERLGGDTLLWEFTSYHAGPRGMVTGAFLPSPDAPVIRIELDDTAQAEKRRMRACFRSQQEMLAVFPQHVELFRPAPHYDFGKPPHPGRLLYETRRRAWTGAHWRRRARAATRLLQTRPPLDALRPGPAQALYGQVRTAIWRRWLAI